MSLIILSVIFSFFAFNRKHNIEQRLETLVETIQLQRNWHGLNLDNYSLAIIINSFFDKNNDIIPKQVIIKNSYLKQYNLSEHSPIDKFIPFNFLIQDIEVHSYVAAYQLLLWFIYSIFTTGFFYYLYFLGKKHIESNQLLKIAKQINHDIKAPINTLQTLLKANNELSKEQVVLIMESISRISEISLDFNTSPNSNKNETISIGEMLSAIKRSFAAQNKRIKLTTNISMSSQINREIIRHITNIVNNAFEASFAGDYVYLEVSQCSDFLQISVQDKGTGIPEYVLKKIAKGKPVTYGKSAGQGIGLASARDYIDGLGGKLLIKSLENIGTTVSLLIPNKNRKTIVHLDDDPFIRKAWQIDANKNGIKLLSFETYGQLQKQLALLAHDSYFYIDKNLSNGIDGIDISRKLSKTGFKNIFLSTGEDIDISKYPFIKGISNKISPF